MHILVVRKVRITKRHAERHHVDDHPCHGDIGEDCVVPSPLECVERLGDATRDGYDETSNKTTQWKIMS